MSGRLSLAAAMILLPVTSLQACPVCSSDSGEQIRAGLFDGSFAFNLFVLALPFVILLGFIFAVHVGLPRPRDRKLKWKQAIASAGLALGIGMGGFIDGIVFHQILQVHNMLSARRAPETLENIKINMVWDGLFHLFTWMMVVIGIALLWSAVRSSTTALSTRTLVGSMIAGWGLFNLVEGLINHHLLHLHHLVERMGPSIWDWIFLGSGVLFLLIGGMLVRQASTTARTVRT